MMKSSNATGSRYQNGNVPNVNWNSDNGKLYVRAYNPQNANDNLRARAECDVRKFFDSIDQAILMDLIKKKISDGATLELVALVLQSFHNEDGKGLPLGNVTSQLFANIYLNELDQFMKHDIKINYYLRYCDDFIILSENRDESEAVVIKVQNFLTNRLKLSLHDKKIIIRKLNQGIDFLGYVVLPYYRVLRTKTKNRIFRKIDEKALPSYLGVLSHCRGYKIRKILLDAL
jgi:RNA-directed DNA polymerase